MLGLIFEGAITLGGIILGGQAFKLASKWIKYGVKKLSPPDEKKDKQKEVKVEKM